MVKLGRAGELIFCTVARFQFYHSLFQVFLPYRHPHRASDQVRIVEFDTGTLSPVIEKDRDTRHLQTYVKFFRFGPGIYFFSRQLHQVNFERRGGGGQFQALFVVVYLSQGSKYVFKTKAVVIHQQLSLGGKKRCPTIRARVTGVGDNQISRDLGVVVSSVVCILQVISRFISPGNQVGRSRYKIIHHDQCVS